jgi:hypothetical protein
MRLSTVAAGNARTRGGEKGNVRYRALQGEAMREEGSDFCPLHKHSNRGGES